MSAADVVALAASAALGYALGSLPLGALVGRMAGAEGSATAASIWRDAGLGWGLLALSVDLARGVLPVTLAIVTFSWTAGAAAGIGAVAGTIWPAFGRLPADRSLILALGAALVVVPVVGLAAVVIAVLATVLRGRSATG